MAECRHRKSTLIQKLKYQYYKNTKRKRHKAERHKTTVHLNICTDMPLVSEIVDICINSPDVTYFRRKLASTIQRPSVEVLFYH